MRLKTRPYLWSSLLLFSALALNVAVGSVWIPPGKVLQILLDQLPGVILPQNWDAVFPIILLKVRLPHAVLMLLTGAALSGSGAAYQGLFRNPLADPFLIGVASGAGLGAVAAMAYDWPGGWSGYFGIPAAAFVGALVTVLLVYSLARTGKSLPAATLILAGVAVSSLASAITSYLMLRSDQELRRAIGWLMGGASLGGWEPVLGILPYALLGGLLLIVSAHPINVLQFGEEQARQLGLNVNRAKNLVILAASLTTAAAVAYSGIIGFVGLVVPHIVRITWGSDYRRIVPLSFLGGGAALLIADVGARVIIAPQVLPIGIVTALVGGPFFLWILRRARRQVYW